MQILKPGLKKWETAAMRRRSRKFRNHSEIFATIAKITSGIFSIIAKFRYGSENMYGPLLTDRRVHSEVSKRKKKKKRLLFSFFFKLFYCYYFIIYINIYINIYI